MIPLRLLSLTAVIVLGLTKEIVAPVRIESITEWNIIEVKMLDKIEIWEASMEKEKIYSQMHQYLISEYVKPALRRHQIVDAVYQYSIEFNLERALVLAIIYEESDPKWNPTCVSNKGARGLMQIMPLWDETLMEEGIIDMPEQIFEPSYNIRAGCYILDYIIGGCLEDDDLDIALCLYHSGHEDITKDGNQKYVTKVRETMARIEKYMGGE